MTDCEIKIFPSIVELNSFARDEIRRLSASAIGKRGIFTIVLSGGSTPKKLYALLAEKEFQKQINWQKIHFFFGDFYYSSYSWH